MARNEETWAQRIARESRANIIRRLSPAGWAMLVPDVQEALIARDVLAKMASRMDQDRDDGLSAESCWRAVMNVARPDDD